MKSQTWSWRNQSTHWGMSAVLMHWIVALTVFGLFALGWWMTGLTYYDPWYKQGPFIHKSIGFLLGVILIARLLWRHLDPAPHKLNTHARYEQQLADCTHKLLYVLLVLILVSGYFISTADGRAISVFNWFEIPATLHGLENQEEIAGKVHWYLACSLMGLVALHVLGALKHQLVDKDGTLTRMLGRKPK